MEAGNEKLDSVEVSMKVLTGDKWHPEVNGSRYPELRNFYLHCISIFATAVIK